MVTIISSAPVAFALGTGQDYSPADGLVKNSDSAVDASLVGLLGSLETVLTPVKGDSKLAPEALTEVWW